MPTTSRKKRTRSSSRGRIVLDGSNKSRRMLANLIWNLRTTKDIGTVDVCQRAKVCRTTLRRLENGTTTRPHCRTVFSILDALGCDAVIVSKEDL